MNKPTILYAVALYGSAGIQLAISVVGGLVLGNYIDGKIGTSPWLAVIGTMVGTIGGIWNLVRILKLGSK